MKNRSSGIKTMKQQMTCSAEPQNLKGFRVVLVVCFRSLFSAVSARLASDNSPFNVNIDVRPSIGFLPLFVRQFAVARAMTSRVSSLAAFAVFPWMRSDNGTSRQWSCPAFHGNILALGVSK
jgi:hypothetical protein